MRSSLRDRALTTILIVWAAVTLAFFALQVLPGDAMRSQMLQGGASTEEVEAQRIAQGLNDPPVIRYARYLAGLAKGDFGYSLVSKQPVNRLISEQFGATATLAAAALSFAVLTGLGLGTLEAIYRSHILGQAASIIIALALSTPIYWSATLAIYVFTTRLGLLPATGSASLRHLLLPAGVLGLHVGGSIARVTSSSMHQTLHADFVRTALAKGLRTRQILAVHVLRASLPPIVAVIALQMGFLLGGTVITEMIFVRRGIGQLLQQAVLDQDYPVVLGIVILSAVVYSLVGALADIIYGVLDPRMWAEGRG